MLSLVQTSSSSLRFFQKSFVRIVPRKRNETRIDPESDKFVIVLLGPSGTGKSSFIAHATGQNVEIGHFLTACTRSLDTFEKRLSDGRKVIFVDTPGYDLANKNPNRVLHMLTQWLKTQSAGGTRITLNAILIFHRINDNRMPIATQSHIHRFEKLIGKKRGIQKRIHLITTMWDEIDAQTGDFREIQLKTEFWKTFINEDEEEGCNTISRFKRSFSSAWEILNPIVGSQSEDTLHLPFPSSSPPSVFDHVFHEELEDEDDLEALNALEQIHQEQKGLLERLQSAIQEQGGRQVEMLREVVVEGKKVSGRLGTLLNRFKGSDLSRSEE